jgi:hypothetical protein
MAMLASLRSDLWTTCPELVDDFVGIRAKLNRPQTSADSREPHEWGVAP